jgi:hypothetical protein
VRGRRPDLNSKVAALPGAQRMEIAPIIRTLKRL